MNIFNPLVANYYKNKYGGGSGGGGGSAVSVTKKDVNFYDYDGTLLHSYTVAEAQALTELPALPEREGLICQGWNWSLDDIKAHNRAVDVGATYITDDGKTRLYITLPEGRTSPMVGVCPKGTVTVDWGDGSEPDVLTGTSTSTVAWTPNHQYAKAGDYVITLTVDGEMGFYGASSINTYAAIMRHSSSADPRNETYQFTVERVEIGSGIPSIADKVFTNCRYLRSVSIPRGVTSMGMYAFQNCIQLRQITIPDTKTIINESAFSGCTSAILCTPNGVKLAGGSNFKSCGYLESIILSNECTSVGMYLFSTCRKLRGLHIPSGVATIGSGAFQNCVSLQYVDFSTHTSVPTLSSSYTFDGTTPDFEIRVPAALYDEWIAATNWATRASNIVAR